MSGDIARWLEGLDLSQYAEAFAENDIDTDVLTDLDEADLEKLGLSMGHRKRLLRAIGELAPEAKSQPPSSAEAERRQLTVMFCDLVGSTALSSQLDPEDLRDVIRAYQDACAAVVARYEGFVAKYMGDGVLVYFGYPTAHEDDATRAISTGLGIVEAVATLGRGLAVRVGIATGTVVVGDIVGEGASREAAITGETPNLAARLQEIAGPGEIAIAETTYALAGGMFELADLGLHDLRGLADPVRVWRVEGTRATKSRFEASSAGQLTSFIGREHEIALLLDRWERAKEGEGQVVLLSGEAGIGKSRVFQMLRQNLADEPCTRLRYQCSPHYTASALQPVIGQLEQAAGFASDDPPAARLDKIEALLSQSTDDVAAVTPLFAALLSVPTDSRYSSLEVTAQRRKVLTLQALNDQLMGLASRRPVLMTFEDVQWIDPTTLEMLGEMLDLVQHERILAVITFRPEFDVPWHGHGHVTMLTLNRLTRSQCGDMVQRVTDGKALPGEVLNQIVAKTDGVPLFVEELTKTVLESGLLEDTGDRFELNGPLPTLAIPATLKDSLMARLDRLASVKELAQTCAAIGREFPARLLARVIQGEPADLERDLARLVEAGLIFRRGAGEDARYVFKHALVQDTAYESLLRSSRQRLHQRIAEAIAQNFPDTAEAEPEILAHHYTEAGLVEPAIEHWRRAGERSVARSANFEAISHFERSLDLLATLPAGSGRDDQELDLTLLLGGSQLMARGHGASEVETSYKRALELCGTADGSSRRVRALFGLWRYFIVVPDFRNCLDLSRQLLEHGTRSENPVAQMLGHYGDGFSRMMMGEIEPARRSLDAALEVYRPDQRDSPAFRQGQDPAEACLVYRGLALWQLGFPDAARASADEGLALAATIADPYTQAHGHTFHALLDHIRRDQMSQRHHTAEAVRLAKEYGFSLWEIWAGFYGHWLDAETDPESGIEVLRGGMRNLEDIGIEIYRPLRHSMLAEIYHRAGRFDDALDEISAGLAAAEATNERSWEAEMRRLGGAFLLARDDDAEAAEVGFRRALEIARHQQARSLELRAAMSLARLWHDQSKTAEALDLLAPVYSWFTEGFDTADLKDAKALLDELE